jgi:hypothetical protein
VQYADHPGDPHVAIARNRQIDPSVARWYHCMTRCVRRAFLLGDGASEREEWIEKRIEELAQIFAVAVGGFSVMNNHLHLLLRLDPKLAEGWSDEEVVRRWGRLFPPRDKSRKPLPVTEAWVHDRLSDAAWVARARERLQSIGWFILLVDYTGRLFRMGKAAISAEVAGIFDRLAITADTWRVRLEKLRSGRLYGRFFASTRERLKQQAARLGVRSVWNLGGCPAG